MIPIKAFSHGKKVIFKIPGETDVIAIIDITVESAAPVVYQSYTKEELEEKLGELDSEFSFLKAIADSGIFEQ